MCRSCSAIRTTPYPLTRRMRRSLRINRYAQRRPIYNCGISPKKTGGLYPRTWSRRRTASFRHTWRSTAISTSSARRMLLRTRAIRRAFSQGMPPTSTGSVMMTAGASVTGFATEVSCCTTVSIKPRVRHSGEQFCRKMSAYTAPPAIRGKGLFADLIPSHHTVRARFSR